MNPLMCLAGWSYYYQLLLHMRAMGLGDERAPASDHPVSSGVGLGIPGPWTLQDYSIQVCLLVGGEKETEGRANVVSGTQESTVTRKVLMGIKSFPLELRGTSTGCPGRLP